MEESVNPVVETQFAAHFPAKAGIEFHYWAGPIVETQFASHFSAKASIEFHYWIGLLVGKENMIQ